MAHRSETALHAAVLVALGAAAYANSLTVPFVFDDRVAIVQNEHLRTLWPPWRPMSAPPRSVLSGRPVVSLTLAWNYALGGLDVRGYHLVNLALHVLAALVLRDVVRRTLLTPRLVGRFAASASTAATAVAAVWLVHPLHTEAVTYVTQRTELLMGLCYLLTLAAALRGWTAASILCCALGMASKETMVSAPLAVVLHDRVFAFPSLAAALRARWRLYVGLAATWAVLAASLLLAPRHPGFGAGMTAWQYARTELTVIPAYLRLALWPAALCIDHGVRVARTASEILPGTAVTGVLVVGTLAALYRHRPVGFLGAWLLLGLAPTSSIVPIATEPMAERRMYLPLAAVAALVVLGGSAIGRRLGWRSGLRLALVTTLVATLGALTVRRNHDYRTEIALWQDAVRKLPGNARAHQNLGALLLDAGDADGAAAEFQTALGRDPDSANVRYNLGTALVAQGQLEDAAARFAEALHLDQTLAGAHYNLGTVRLHQGRLAEAIAHYRETLRLEPEHRGAATNLKLAEEILARSPGR